MMVTSDNQGGGAWRITFKAPRNAVRVLADDTIVKAFKKRLPISVFAHGVERALFVVKPCLTFASPNERASWCRLLCVRAAQVLEHP